MSADNMGPQPFAPGWRFFAAFAALMVVNMAAALDATSISVALPIIATELNGTAIEAFWAGTSFLLASTVFQPNFVSFSHALGRREVLLFALVLFAAGSAMCGAATNFTLMLSGRSIQGVGGGGIIALTEILVTDMVPLRQRGKYFSLINIVWAVGSVSGPLVGGVLAEKNAWRWIFYLNLPIVAIGFIGVVAFLNLEKRKAGLLQKLREIDYFGSFIFVASLTSFLIPITWGGIMYDWDNWHALVPMLVGIFGLVIFVFYENLPSNTHTLIPLSLFGNYTTSISFLTTFIHGMILWSILYYIPLYFEAIRGYSPILTGVAILPQTLTVVPCAIAVGLIAAKSGHYRWALWLGWALTVLGVGLLYLLDVHSNTVQCIFLMHVSGIGMGLLFPSTALSIQASAPPEDVAIAAAMFSFFRALGQTVGVAIGGVIFQNRIITELAKYPDLAEFEGKYSLDPVALVQVIKGLGEDLPQVLELKTGFAQSLKIIWLVMCGLGGVGLFFSLFIKGYNLDQVLVTEQGLRDMTRGQGSECEEVSPVTIVTARVSVEEDVEAASAQKNVIDWIDLGLTFEKQVADGISKV